ncbi:MAG: EpsD family peptidyl-prolyl cis-trans isomerase [Burkholderiaceae bacterium]
MVATALVVLTGCGDKKDKPATQTAAKVNKEEITIHQINYMLQQQRGLAPEQAASASKVVLERLIDQEVALQKAQDQKLDRDPRVVQQLEAARREIIARAYVEKISAGAPKPSAAEIKAYYEEHPALFKNRRVYNLQELQIQATPEQVPALQAKLKAAKDIGEFVAYLKENDYKYGVNQAVRGAEQLPLASVDRFAEMKDGQAMLTATPAGVQVVLLAGSRVQPIDDAKATPAIEQYLLNERKRKVVADDLKALRAAVKIEYVGDFAKGGSKEMAAPTDLGADTAPLTSIAPPLPAASIPSAAPQLEVEPIKSEPASAPTKGTLEKGMKGFK